VILRVVHSLKDVGPGLKRVRPADVPKLESFGVVIVGVVWTAHVRIDQGAVPYAQAVIAQAVLEHLKDEGAGGSIGVFRPSKSPWEDRLLRHTIALAQRRQDTNILLQVESVARTNGPEAAEAFLRLIAAEAI
jgi:hypothetical protein